VREQARARGSERLLRGDIERLSAVSREDLVRSEVVYHGAVDDLGRSAHLLAVVLERELRVRIVDPTLARANACPRPDAAARKFRKDLPNAGLSRILELMRDIASEAEDAGFRGELRQIWAPARESLQGLADALDAQVRTVNEDPVSIRDVRNAVAHGRDVTRLGRLEVDALRRKLALERPVLLAQLARLPSGEEIAMR
jgi:hypothetical protein